MTEIRVAARPGRLARTALILLIVSAIAAGFSGTLVRLSEVGPVATAFWRMGLAIPAMMVWAAVEGRAEGVPVRTRRPRDFVLLVTAGLLFAAEIGIWHWSLAFTSVANATLLANFAPLFVTVGGWLVLGQRFSRAFLGGLALALMGATILMGESLTVSLTQLAGDALALATALLFGAYILVIAALRAHLPTALIMTWTCVFAAPPLLVFAWTTESALLPASLAGWATVLAIALICQAGAQGLLAYALAHLPAAFSALGYLIVPISAAAIAWLVLGEAVGPWQAAGASVVLAGIVIARRGSR